MSGTLSTPFDRAAAGYDERFTSRPLGRMLRDHVWSRATPFLPAGGHLLELGCGTGEDARFLAGRGHTIHATDSSRAMLEIAAAKAREAGVGDRIAFSLLDLAAPTTYPTEDARYDGAYANFGPLNCVGERRQVARMLARVVRPGGVVVLVVMGPLCPWEIGVNLLAGRPRTAFRRWRDGGEARVGPTDRLPVWYPSPQRLAREFDGAFDRLHLAGIGFLLPTSEHAGLVERWPKVFRLLARMERRSGSYVPFPWLADHYLMVLRRATRGAPEADDPQP